MTLGIKKRVRRSIRKRLSRAGLRSDTGRGLPSIRAIFGTAQDVDFDHKVQYQLHGTGNTIGNLAAGANYGGSVKGVDILTYNTTYTGVGYAGGFGTVQDQVAAVRTGMGVGPHQAGQPDPEHGQFRVGAQIFEFMPESGFFQGSILSFTGGRPAGQPPSSLVRISTALSF